MKLPGYKYKVLTEKELETLTTKRLLSFLKIHRPKIMSFIHFHYCECCGTPSYELNFTEKDDLYLKEKEKWLNEIHSAENYLDTIKTILDKRENIS